MDEQITEDGQNPAEEAPAEGPETYAEVAKEMYGDKFVGEVEEPEEIEESEEPEFFENERDAAKYFIDKHRAAERIDQDLAEDVPAPAPIQTEAEPVTDAVWSNKDVANFQTFNEDLRLFQEDAQKIEQIKTQLNQSGLERTDRAQAVAYQAQIRAAERELAQRQQALTGRQDKLSQKAEKHTAARGQNMLRAEEAKIMAAVPDYEPIRVGAYLEKSGFTRGELSELSDSRMAIVADKARRWDEHVAGKGPKKVPKTRKKAPGAPRRATGKSVAELKVRMENTGKMDDALAWLTASRRASQSKGTRP